MNIETAKKYIYQNARPLDFARWKFHFENGSRQDVIEALAVYQNADGGFGDALEPDCWNPFSSPIQTWVATQIIREIKLEEKNNFLIKGILNYLDTTESFNGHTWNNTISSNDEYPHAPWWNYVPSEELNYNPTVSLAGFILKYADTESKIYRKAVRIISEAYEWLKENSPIESMHTVACFVELFEDLRDLNSEIVNITEFEELIRVQINHVLTQNTTIWNTEYVCKPSLFIHTKESIFYLENKQLCDFERDFISETQSEDGTWNITWDWDCFPEQWHISKNWWKSDLIIKNISFYYNMECMK